MSTIQPTNPHTSFKEKLVQKLIQLYADGSPPVLCLNNQPQECKNDKTSEKCKKIFDECIRYYHDEDRWSRMN